MKFPSWLGKAGLFGFSNWALIAAGAIIIGSLFGVGYLKGRSDGRSLERAAWEASAKETIEARWQAYVKANKEDLAITDLGESGIEQRREEIDNEKLNIPDQGLTARQSVRACAELRRQDAHVQFLPPPPAALAEAQKSDLRPAYPAEAATSEAKHEEWNDNTLDWGDRRNLLAYRWCKLWNTFSKEQVDCGPVPE